MTVTAAPSTTVVAAFAPTLRRLHVAAVVRIVFGVVWAVDAHGAPPDLRRGDRDRGELHRPGADPRRILEPAPDRPRVFSFGIWSAAEGLHLPWSKPGITDLGPSVGCIFASLGLAGCESTLAEGCVDGHARHSGLERHAHAAFHAVRGELGHTQ
jgi:hypothetical protein